MAVFTFLKRNKDLDSTADNRRYNSQVIRHRMLVAGRFLAIFIFVAVVIVAFYFSYENKQYTDYEIVTEEDRTDSESAVYIPYNGNVIKYSQDGAEAFEGNNTAIWNETFEMQNPIVATCETYAAMGDFKGNRIYVVSSDGKTGEIDTKLPVSTFCVSRQGVVAAVLEDDNETKVNIYDYEGNLLAEIKCTMTQSGYPIDVTLSEDGKKLGIAYVRIEEGQLKSSVAFYNFGEVGQNETDNYVSGYDYVDAVVPRLKFINNSTAFGLGDNRFVIYQGTQKPVSLAESFINDEIKSVFYGKNNVGLVFYNTGLDNKYKLDIYDEKGEMVQEIPFDIEYTDIVFNDDMIIIYNERECTMYKINGAIKYNGVFKDPVLLLVPTDNKTKYILVNRDGVQTVRLR